MEHNNLEEYSKLLIQIASMMMEAGADTKSTQLYLDRFAQFMDCQLEMSATHWAIAISVIDKTDSSRTCSKVKRIPRYGVNFARITDLSTLSRKVVLHPQEWSLARLTDEVELLAKQKAHYSPGLMILMVGLASAGFTYLFGGDVVNMLVTLLAGSAGLYCRMQAQKKLANTYYCIGLAAFTSCFIAMLGMYFELGTRPDLSVATSVLHLIPGAVFVVSFVDFIEARVINGIVRLAHALIISLFITTGMLVAMSMFHLKVF